MVLVVALFVLHFRQEVAYWEELEGVVRAERQAREEAQVRRLRAAASAPTTSEEGRPGSSTKSL